MKFYELRLDCYDYYRTLIYSASKERLEQLIKDVRAHDAKYISPYDDDEAHEDWEDNHPLAPYKHEIEDATGKTHFGEDLEDTKDGTWASDLSIYTCELEDFDPFATLNFYLDESGDYYAHGKNRTYFIRYSELRQGYYAHFGDGLSLSDKTLEQAQAWCQADYDKYYGGLSDDI